MRILHRRKLRIRVSSAATSGPCVTHPERIARSAALTSSSPRLGRATGTNSLDMARDIPALPLFHDILFQELGCRFPQTGIPVEET